MRNLTPDMAEGFSSGSVKPALLAEFMFDSGMVGMWSGYGTLTWGAKEFLGGGNFVGIGPIEETQELQAKGTTVSLNGINAELVALALDEPVKNRPFRLYLAEVDAQRRLVTEDDAGAILTEDGDHIILENNLVNAPYRMFSGLMDTLEFSISGKEANIRLNVENILIIGQRAKISRYTDEEQRKRFPDDKGLEFINRLQDREIVW